MDNNETAIKIKKTPNNWCFNNMIERSNEKIVLFSL